MSEPTASDADRAKAAEPLTALEWLRVTHAGTLSGRRIEEAIAAERAEGEALRAAVLALAEEIDTAADVQNVLGAGDGRIRQLIELADRLRAAVEPR